MSAWVSIYNVDKKWASPFTGIVALPELAAREVYDDAWDVTLYTFGWIYDGLASMGLVTADLDAYRRFLEQSAGDRIVVLVDGEGCPPDVDLDAIDDEITPWEPPERTEFELSRYAIQCERCGESYCSEESDQLVPQERRLTKENIDNFIGKLASPEQIDDMFDEAPPLLNPWGELGKIRSFVAQHRHGPLRVLIAPQPEHEAPVRVV